MDSGEFRTLRLFETIEKDDSASQRVIASRLGISVGLVNSFIKRLAKKGYLKIMTIPKNRVKYILTAKGAAEKTKLTYQFILFSLSYYRENCSKISDLFEKLENQKIVNVLFYGQGDLSEIAKIIIGESNLKLIGFIEDNMQNVISVRNQQNRDVLSESIHFDAIIITQDSHVIEAKKQLKEKFRNKLICTI